MNIKKRPQHVCVPMPGVGGAKQTTSRSCRRNFNHKCHVTKNKWKSFDNGIKSEVLLRTVSQFSQKNTFVLLVRLVNNTVSLDE